MNDGSLWVSLQTSERVPRLCAQLLPHIRAWAKERPSFPVASWQEFVKKVKEVNKTADEDGVRNVAFYLNESAEVRGKITATVHLLYTVFSFAVLRTVAFPLDKVFDLFLTSF